jgi:hypothetical protein
MDDVEKSRFDPGGTLTLYADCASTILKQTAGKENVRMN